MRLPAVKIRHEVIKLVSSEKKIRGKLLEIREAECDGGPRFLIAVPKRCGKAVRRNRIKRIIREWCRVNYDVFPEGTMWFIKVSPAVKELSDRKLSKELRGELAELFSQLIGRRLNA